jgi:plasmid stabilization system protein ParE
MVPPLRVRIRPEARADLSAASTWYAEQGPGLGSSFLAEVREQLRRISERPESFPIFHNQTRRALIKRFPYGIVYLVEHEHSCIIVLAVLHCGRDPRLWRTRSQR